MLGIQAKEFNLSFIRLENLVFHGLIVFTEEWIPSGRQAIKA